MILSGGANNGNTISEAEKMYQILQKRNIPEIRPDVNIILEDQSTDTAKNIRNSVWLGIDNGIIIPEEANSYNKDRIIIPEEASLDNENIITIIFLTSLFHILRT